MSALVVPERQVLLEFPDDPTYSLHHRVLFVRVQDALWVVGTPDYEVGVRDLGTHPERVTPLVRGAPWPRGVDAAQVYLFQDEGDLDARLLVMRRTARQLAEVLGAEGYGRGRDLEGMGGRLVKGLDFSRDRNRYASHRRRHQVPGPLRLRLGAFRRPAQNHSSSSA